MFLKSLTIKNFRCFDRKGIKLNLNKGLTAFIGRNGSGKTAILEALNFLIGRDYLPTRISEKDFNYGAKGIKDEIFIEGETASPFFITIKLRSNYGRLETVIIPCNKIRLTIRRRESPEKVLDDPFVITKHVLPIIGKVDEIIYKEKETARKALQVSKLEGGYRVDFRLKSGEVRNAKIIDYQLIYNPSRVTNFPKSYYLTTNRENDASGNYSLIAKILTDLNWKYQKKRKKDSQDSIENEYKKLAASLRDTVDEKSALINAINEKIKTICSNNKNFQIDFIDIDQPYKSAFITKTEGDKLLLPDNLGSGFNILIAYALFNYVAGQEKMPIVLIVDEPELHLHSDWQQKMYNVFSDQKDMQIVYSTQSENFISLKNWQQIRSITNAQIFPQEEFLNEKIKATDGEEGSLSDFLDDYAKRNLHISLILKENLGLFFARKCILVEGPSEKYALPKLLNLINCDLSLYSVSIIPVWGKTKIKIYQTICRVFNIDYFTVFDQDKTEGKQEDENAAIENNIKGENIVKFSTSFEKLFGISKDDEFQKLVKKIDDTTNIDLINPEIKTAVEDIKKFIES